jgi:glycine/D-amino acid oxidase-like deaminating enzyme
MSFISAGFLVFLRPGRRQQLSVGGGPLGTGVASLASPLNKKIHTHFQYFRREAHSTSKFLTGISPPADKDEDMFDDVSATLAPSDREKPPEVDHSLWEGLWEGLAARVTHFEGVRAEGSWAGFYEYNTVDQNGIIGRHPDLPNMLLACGFSGHGASPPHFPALYLLPMLLQAFSRALLSVEL